MSASTAIAWRAFVGLLAAAVILLGSAGSERGRPGCLGRLPVADGDADEWARTIRSTCLRQPVVDRCAGRLSPAGSARAGDRHRLEGRQRQRHPRCDRRPAHGHRDRRDRYLGPRVRRGPQLGHDQRRLRTLAGPDDRLPAPGRGGTLCGRGGRGHGPRPRDTPGGEQRVAIVDGRADDASVLGWVEPEAAPAWVAIDQATRRAFVPMPDAGQVAILEPIDPAPFYAVTGIFESGPYSRWLAVDQETGRLLARTTASPSRLMATSATGRSPCSTGAPIRLRGSASRSGKRPFRHRVRPGQRERLRARERRRPAHDDTRSRRVPSRPSAVSPRTRSSTRARTSTRWTSCSCRRRASSSRRRRVAWPRRTGVTCRSCVWTTPAALRSTARSGIRAHHRDRPRPRQWPRLRLLPR